MRTRTEFPRQTRVIEHAEIRLSDGVTLSAMIWLPVDAEQDPVPAILEYLPYRKRDGTTERDALTHPYFAGHGYACVRVDMRGSGDSEGVLKGEYLKQEQDDALEVLRWIAAQPWCTGAVGIIGISWGGFNGLQIAARRPPELKAVISLCSTDDRYEEDIHFMGGCLLVDKFAWGSTMFAINATPPDPALVGDKWRDIWMQRLEGSGFWLDEWHRRQRRDEFYKHGSICEDYSAIECPVYLVGGWADGYSNAIFRMLANLRAPTKALVGPWAHKYPHFAFPGPQIGFLQECLRWWDKWLKGIETGVMEEPPLRAWMQDSVPPRTWYAERPGRWVAEESWPSPRIVPTRLALSAGRLEAPGARSDGVLSICSPQTVGLAAGKWCAYGLDADQPGDQREEAGGSLLFDSERFEEPFEFLGAPALHLKVASDKPDAFVAVTLSEVLPDGAATRLTYGILNLTHRDGHENLKALEPGRFYDVRVQLNECGQRIAAGNRLRLAISTSYWPVVWPSPEAATLSIDTSGSALELPVRPGEATTSERTVVRLSPYHESPNHFRTVTEIDGEKRWFEKDRVTVIKRSMDTILLSMPKAYADQRKGISSLIVDYDNPRPFEPAEAATPVRRTQLRPAGGRIETIRVNLTGEARVERFTDEGLMRLTDFDWEYGTSARRLYSVKPDAPCSAEARTHWRKHFGRGDFRIHIDARTTMRAARTEFVITGTLDAFEGETRVFSKEWACTIPRDHV